MKKKLMAMLLIGVGMLSGCSSDSPSGDDSQTSNSQTPNKEVIESEASVALRNISPETKARIEAGNDFAFKMFGTIAQGENYNFTTSPVSLNFLMGLLANADNKEARNAILSLEGYSADEAGMQAFNEYNELLLSLLPKVDEFTDCIFYNSVWCDSPAGLLTSYADVTKRYLQAEEVPMSPAGHEGMEAINSKVSQNTKGLIDKFLDTPLTGNLALLNTTYFKSKWNAPFDPANTKSAKFIGLSGSDVEVPFMSMSDQLYYGENNGIRIVRMPFGNGGFCMYAIAPSDNNKFEELCSSITATSFASLISSMRPHIVNLSMPKFETTSKFKLSDIMNSVGARDVFSNPYNSIMEYPVILQEVRHAANFSVTEEGAEGAGASLGEFFTSSGNEPAELDKIELRLDHPFIYVVREIGSGAIIFMGAVSSPE